MENWPEVEHFNPINERMLPVLVYDPRSPFEKANLLWMRENNAISHRLSGKIVVYCYGQIVDQSDYPLALSRAFREYPGWEVPLELYIPNESEYMRSIRDFVGKHLRFAIKWLPEQKSRKIKNPEHFHGAIRVPDLRGITSVQMPPFRCGTFM